MWNVLSRWFRREDGKHRPPRAPHTPRHERPHRSPQQRWLEDDFDKHTEEER